MSTPAPKPEENPLANILINVILPVLALTQLSKDGGSFWHLGPERAMAVALTLPLGYGIWHFVNTRKFNMFSAIGLFSVLLTGGLTIYLWNDDGTVKPNAAQLFGLKEASIPLVLGICIFASHWSKTPLLRAFLYSDSIFDIRKIEKKVAAHDKQIAYDKLLFRCTILFASSFLISVVLNYFVALHFLNGVTDKEAYNEGVGKITGWGFAIIGVPFLIFMMVMFFSLINGLKKLTGLETDDLLQPR